jgi:PadR family transcriptional regulator
MNWSGELTWGAVAGDVRAAHNNKSFTYTGHMHTRRPLVRCRWRVGDTWVVRARVERFIEPALLLLLRERPLHGYDLLEQVPQLTGDDRGVDLGNLYRVLRALEDDALVRSEWHAEIAGPAKRVYELTDSGIDVLDQWAEALTRTRSDIDGFLERHRQGKRERR